MTGRHRTPETHILRKGILVHIVKKIVATASVLTVLAVGMAACDTENNADAGTRTASYTAAPVTTIAKPAPTTTAKPAPSLEDIIDRSQGYRAPTTIAPTTTTPHRSIDEIVFLMVLDKYGFAGTGEQNLIDSAHTTCDYLDTGGSVASAGMIALKTGISGTKAGALIGASVAAFCPRHQSAVDAFSATYGGGK